MNELLSLLIRNDRQDMNDALELLTHQEKAPLSPTRVGEREALSDLLGDRRACSLQNIKRRSSCRSHDLLGTRGDRRACSLQKGKRRSSCRRGKELLHLLQRHRGAFRRRIFRDSETRSRRDRDSLNRD